MAKVKIKIRDEEHIDFIVVDRPTNGARGIVIGNVNHDEHGWSGMRASRHLIENLCAALGVEVIVEGESGED